MSLQTKTVILRKAIRGASGSQIAEAAIVFPLLFTFFIGIFWFGRAFNIYATITHSAREGARAGVARTCGTCASPNVRLSADQIADVVKQGLLASRVDPAAVQPLVLNSFVSCNFTSPACQKPVIAGEPNICVYYDVQLNNPPANYPPTACGVAVAFYYPYTFWLPFTSLSQSTVNIPANVQMIVEN
jgi:hypothetical protein